MGDQTVYCKQEEFIVLQQWIEDGRSCYPSNLIKTVQYIPLVAFYTEKQI